MKKISLKNSAVKLNKINLIKVKTTCQKKREFRFLFYIIIAFTLAIIYVWERVEIDAVSMNINKLKERKAGLIAYNEILKAEISNEARFDLIEKMAREKLNMEFPGNNSVILVLEKSGNKSFFGKITEHVKSIIRKL